MLSEKEARDKLNMLIDKYISDVAEKIRLSNIVNDIGRPGLPVRGVLEEIKKYKTQEYTNEEKEIIEELIYMYG